MLDKLKVLWVVFVGILCTTCGYAQTSAYDFVYNNLLCKISDATQKYVNVVGMQNQEISDVYVDSQVYGNNSTYTVRWIDDRAFKNCTNLVSATIADGVYGISSESFAGCEKLQRIQLPTSLQKISSTAFANCPALESIEVSPANTVYASQNGILYNKDMTELILYPEGKQAISYSIPLSITRLDGRIINPYLQNVFIHKNVSFIDINSFRSCANLLAYEVDVNNRQYSSHDGVLYEQGTYFGEPVVNLFAFPSGKEILVIPNSIRKVFGETLRFATHLKKVRIEDGTTPVSFEFYQSYDKPSHYTPYTETLFFLRSPIEEVYIGRDFYIDDNHGLFGEIPTIHSVTIGGNATTLLDETFYNCINLYEVKVSAALKKWGVDVFKNSQWQNKLPMEEGLRYYNNIAIEVSPSLTSVNIKEGVTMIASGLFEKSAIVSVTLPNSLREVPQYMFRDSRNLTHVVFGNQTETIGSSAFSRCSNLQNVKLPNTVKTIGNGAFFSTYLDTLTIPSSVTSIGTQAFYEIKNLIIEDGETPLRVPDNNASDGYFPGIFKFAQKAYFGRNFTYNGSSGTASDPFQGSTITDLTFGPKVTDWSECRTNVGDKLKTVRLLAKESVNPHFSYSGIVALSIPKGTYDNYSIANFWKGFSPIQEVESVVLDKKQEVMTFSSPYDLDFSAFTELEVYLVTGYDFQTGILIPKKVTQVPAGVGMIIKGANGVFNVPCTNISSAVESPLKGVYASKTLSQVEGENVVFTMTYQDNRIMFVKVSVDGIWLGENQTYLLIPQSEIANGTVSLECPIDKGIVLSDNGTPFVQQKEEYFNSIQYQRTFSNTKWQALYVPFAMNYEDWKDHFDVAYLNDVHQFDDDDNGTIDRTQLEIIRITQGGTEANMPYLIRAKEIGDQTISINNAVLKATASNSINCSSTRTLYTFVGTYTGVSGQEMYDNGYFGMGGGKLVNVESPSVDLKPFRWYLSVTDRNGQPYRSIKRIDIVEQGETTGIEQTAATQRFFDVYDINGRIVKKHTNNLDGLQHGIYIVQGKKIIL